MTNTDYILVGKVGSTYGVKGWLKILSYTEVAANILDYSPWYIEDKDGWRTIELEASQQYGKGVIVKFSGIHTPEKARLLSGKKLAILRSELPVLEKDEYYWSDLKGLTVIDQHGKTLGKVSYLIATGSNDVLVVKGEKEQAIPYLPGQVVTRVDLAESKIYVNWDEI